MTVHDRVVPAVEARDASRSRPWLDFVILASLLVLPQSYILFFNSSEFGASLLRRIPVFVIPALLVVVRLARPHARGPSFVDPLVVFLWIAVILQGLTMALIHTQYPANVLSNYGQYFYWLALVAVFLGCVAAESGLYLLDLLRRYFIFVSVIAWVFVALYLVFGSHLPHRAVLMPDTIGGDLVVAQNYYLSVSYSGDSIFGIDLPRFTFLYREPRILGVQLAMGVILQVGYLRGHWRSWSRRERRVGVAMLGVLGGALFWTHSLQGYIFAMLVAAAIGSAWVLGEAFWRNFRALQIGVILTGVAALIVAFVVIGQRSDLQALLETAVAQGYVGDPDVSGTTLYSVLGKAPTVIVEYLATYLGAPRGLLLFPLGWGVMALDSDRFLRDFGLPTTGGGTLLQVFAQNAGFVGLAAFGVILWRLLGGMRSLVIVRKQPEVRYACLLGGFVLVVSTVYLDLISFSPLVPVIFVSLMRLRSEA